MRQSCIVPHMPSAAPGVQQIFCRTWCAADVTHDQLPAVQDAAVPPAPQGARAKGVARCVPNASTAHEHAYTCAAVSSCVSAVQSRKSAAAAIRESVLLMLLFARDRHLL